MTLKFPLAGIMALFVGGKGEKRVFIELKQRIV
jgi:hypothetical protein